MKHVSLSQWLGCPLFGSNSGLFTVLGFIVSLVRIKKKGRRNKKGNEGWKKELSKQKKNGKKERRN